VCGVRMDLMRAVIRGAEGTPYHDQLFFFDIQMSEDHPASPPSVHYHSWGLRINPNLCAPACL
jgi:ubiquitin-conjugating enzyme E2 O